jgi:hypothetical protein
MKSEIKKLGRLLCSKPYDENIRTKYYTKLKCYKKQCKKEHRLYRANIINMMENLQTNNPKTYWKLVEELSDKHKKCTNIEIEKLFNHYKTLNTTVQTDNTHFNELQNEINQLEKIKIFSQLDFSISQKEIRNAIKSLKNGKSAGHDLIKNEMIKYGQDSLIKPLHKIFNLVLNSGYYPHEWSKGRIVSIHKNGDPTLASNYRGITISSVLGKLFNSVLNNRLCEYLNENHILTAEQSGFRKKHRTSDHMFVLKNIMSKYKHDNKPLYIAFIDFKQAFDTIRHQDVLLKLLKSGISNKFYTIIKSMYNNISLTIQSSDGERISPYFISLLGVRQGDNLSPTLFNIFVNDLPKIFDETCDHAIFGDIHLKCMMYADDLLILSESNLGLQEAMNRLHGYCSQWGLTVNTKKTKFMVTKSQIQGANKLTFNNEIIEQVFSFKYLGIEFGYDGSNLITQNDLYKKGLKAYFKLIRSLNPAPKPHISLHLFDHLTKPILLYGCHQ